MLLIKKKKLVTATHFSLASASSNRETICQHLRERPQNWRGCLYTRDWKVVQDHQASVPGPQTWPAQAMLQPTS